MPTSLLLHSSMLEIALLMSMILYHIMHILQWIWTTKEEEPEVVGEKNESGQDVPHGKPNDAFHIVCRNIWMV